jgi:hypothetical protein
MEKLAFVAVGALLLGAIRTDLLVALSVKTKRIN